MDTLIKCAILLLAVLSVEVGGNQDNVAMESELRPQRYEYHPEKIKYPKKYSESLKQGRQGRLKDADQDPWTPMDSSSYDQPSNFHIQPSRPHESSRQHGRDHRVGKHQEKHGFSHYDKHGPSQYDHNAPLQSSKHGSSHHSVDKHTFSKQAHRVKQPEHQQDFEKSQISSFQNQYRPSQTEHSRPHYDDGAKKGSQHSQHGDYENKPFASRHVGHDGGQKYSSNHLDNNEQETEEGKVTRFSSVVEHDEDEEVRTALQEGSVEDIKKIVPKSAMSLELYHGRSDKVPQPKPTQRTYEEETYDGVLPNRTPLVSSSGAHHPDPEILRALRFATSEDHEARPTKEQQGARVPSPRPSRQSWNDQQGGEPQGSARVPSPRPARQSWNEQQGEESQDSARTPSSLRPVRQSWNTDAWTPTEDAGDETRELNSGATSYRGEGHWGNDLKATPVPFVPEPTYRQPKASEQGSDVTIQHPSSSGEPSHSYSHQDFSTGQDTSKNFLGNLQSTPETVKQYFQSHPELTGAPEISNNFFNSHQTSVPDATKHFFNSHQTSVPDATKHFFNSHQTSVPDATKHFYNSHQASVPDATKHFFNSHQTSVPDATKHFYNSHQASVPDATKHFFNSHQASVPDATKNFFNNHRAVPSFSDTPLEYFKQHQTSEIPKNFFDNHQTFPGKDFFQNHQEGSGKQYFGQLGQPHTFDHVKALGGSSSFDIANVVESHIQASPSEPERGPVQFLPNTEELPKGPKHVKKFVHSMFKPFLKGNNDFKNVLPRPAALTGDHPKFAMETPVMTEQEFRSHFGHLESISAPFALASKQAPLRTPFAHFNQTHPESTSSFWSGHAKKEPDNELQGVIGNLQGLLPYQETKKQPQRGVHPDFEVKIQQVIGKLQGMLHTKSDASHHSFSQIERPLPNWSEGKVLIPEHTQNRKYPKKFEPRPRNVPVHHLTPPGPKSDVNLLPSYAQKRDDTNKQDVALQPSYERGFQPIFDKNQDHQAGITKKSLQNQFSVGASLQVQKNRRSERTPPQVHE